MTQVTFDPQAPLSDDAPTPVSTSTEPRWLRRLYIAIAVTIAAGFFYYTHQYWFQAHHGNDQNGYLVGAKRLLETGSMQAKPSDPFELVGRMWVTGHEPGTYYPKYPIGLPAIYAVARAVGGVRLVFLVNPIAMTLALLGVFALVRRLVGSSFYAVLGMLMMAVNPVTLGLVNNANSHATAIFCVVWGLHLLMVWWQEPKAGWHGWTYATLAGLLLGATVTIRYTEGLLLLPMGLCILYVLWDERHSLRTDWRPLLQSVAMCAAWAIPVVALLIVNKSYFNSWTGYDPTHESTAFLWANLAANWDTMLRQFYLTGLIFLFPVALVGLCVWFKHDPRVASVVAAWALPCVFIYTVYYWAPERLNLSYSRFFFTAFPAFVATAAYAMRWIDVIVISPAKLAKVAVVCAAAGLAFGGLTAWKIQDGWGLIPGALLGVVGGAVVCVVLLVRPTSLLAGIGLVTALIAGVSFFESETRWQFEDETLARDVQAVVPPGAVVFSKDRVVHHLQVANEWKFYSVDVFDKAAVKKLATQSAGLDNAQPFQAERAKALHDLLKDDNDLQLGRRVTTLIDAALSEGKRVFVILPKPEFLRARVRFIPIHMYNANVVATSGEPSWAVPNYVSPWSQDERRRLPGAPPQWQVAEVTRRPVTTEPTTAPKKHARLP